MRHKSKQWITVILFAAFISSALPAYASDSNAYKLSEYLEPAETVTELADTFEIASAPKADDPIDSNLIANAETIVGNSSLELFDSDTSTRLSELELYAGNYKYIEVLINGDYANSGDYSCISSDENIVQVDDTYSYFQIQGISAGNASITVVTNDGAECTLNVSVKAAELSFVEEYHDDILRSLIIGTDYDSYINVEIYRLGESEYTDKYTCTSSDESVAKVYVDSNWYWTIEGISAGTATITATNQYGEIGTLNVTVKESGSSGYLYKDAQGNVLEYVIYDNEISITGYKTAKGALTIPSQIEGVNVTGVGSSAFSGCTTLSKLTINSGINHIGSCAFQGCSGLKSVELPDSIEDIESWAFCSCSGLSYFRIPPKITRIEYNTFSGCSLSSVTIPNGVTFIGDSAFSWCKLTSIILPDTLEEIESYAFQGNPIKTIKIPRKVTSLDTYAIDSIDTLESIQVDANNEYYSSKNGILFNKSQTELIRYPVARSNLYYEIPVGVTDIHSNAFREANNLMSVTIPESVTFIGSNAFNSYSLNYLYVLNKTAPVATADAITKTNYYNNQKIVIAVPSGASGYNEAPWSNFTVKKQGTVRPTSAAFSGTEFTVPTYSDEPYLKIAVSPSNAVCKEVIYKIGNKEVYSFSAGTFNTGDPGNYTLTAITKDGHAIAKVKLIVKQNTKYFSDMWDTKHPFYKPIYWAAQHGITNGYSDGTFGVNRNCTRGECVMFLWKMMGKPAVKAVSKSPFKDVPQSHAFYKAILWASQNGITKGYSDGTFGINRNCTRGEIMMFIWRAKDKPAPKTVSKSPFKDVSSTNAFYKAILWGSQKGVTKGYSDGTFGINRNCTRGEIVTFLYRVNAL